MCIGWDNIRHQRGSDSKQVYLPNILVLIVLRGVPLLLHAKIARRGRGAGRSDDERRQKAELERGGGRGQGKGALRRLDKLRAFIYLISLAIIPSKHATPPISSPSDFLGARPSMAAHLAEGSAHG